MIEAVTARLGAERIQDWWERASLPEVRVAVLEACRVLSSYDEDFAALRNGVGWSAAHSHVGHVVASLPELDQSQASHALRAVRAHRRQIPTELRERIFETAAPQLGLTP